MVRNGKILIPIIAVIFVTALLLVCLPFGSNVVGEASGEYLLEPSEYSRVYNGKVVNEPIILTKNGEAYSDYTVAYYLNGNLVSEVKDAGNYTAKVSINDTDPLVELECTFVIDPKPLKIAVGGGVEYSYTGMGYTRNVSPLGICEGDDCDIITTYRGNKEVLEPGVLPVNADNYDMVFATSNPNYSIGETEGNLNLIIKKRTLTLTVNNTSIVVGGTPEFTYTIYGFVNNEDERVLEKKPTITTTATAIGVHRVNATGAVAKNYDFDYKPGNLTINDVGALGNVEGLSTNFEVSGVFAPFTEYTGIEVSPKSEEGKEFIETARKYRMLNFTSKAKHIYDLSYVRGYQVSEKVDVVFHNVTLDTDQKYVIVIIDPNGVVTQITKYEYLNGELSFKAPSLGTVMIFEDSYDITVFLIGVGVVVIFALLLLIASKMQYRNDKKYIEEQKRKREMKRNGGYRWS